MDFLLGTTVFLAILLIYSLVLFAFKKLCLNKIKGQTVRYIFGMTFAYAILVGILILSRESEFVKISLQNAAIRAPAAVFRDASMIFILVPAFYSVFLLGYYKKGRADMEWRNKLQLMASVSINGIGAFFGLLYINYFLDGHSFQEVIISINECFAGIDWIYIPPLILAIALFVGVMKLEHNKNKSRNKASSKDLLEDMEARTHKFIIQGVEVYRGKTLPAVFDKTGYYVDYDGATYVEGVPLISCLVRERANPTHVVGNIGLLDDEGNQDVVPENILRTRPIVDGCALNEMIGYQ